MQRSRERTVLILIAALLIWGAMLVPGMTLETQSDEQILEAFQQVDFALSESTIEAYGSVAGEPLLVQQREALLEAIAGQLNVAGYDIEHTYTEGQASAVLYNKTASAEVKLQFVKVTDSGGEVKQYLLLTLTLYDELEKALNHREQFEQIIQQYSTEYHISMDFKGSTEGYLDLEERGDTADRLLEILAAEVVTEHRSEELFTIYADSSIMRSYEGGSYDNINVNIAMSYHEIEDRTYLYIAAPVVREDY